MENSARYTLIGSFALACLVAAFGFVYWIKNVGGLGQREVYNVRFEQPVSGLTPGANVLFNGIRVGTVDPGLVKTEFSLVRFKGDAARAEKVYAGTNPLVAEDIAEILVQRLGIDG